MQYFNITYLYYYHTAYIYIIYIDVGYIELEIGHSIFHNPDNSFQLYEKMSGRELKNTVNKYPLHRVSDIIITTAPPVLDGNRRNSQNVFLPLSNRISYFSDSY